MKILIPLLMCLVASTAFAETTIVSSEVIGGYDVPDTKNHRVKILVTLSDGTVRDYWPMQEDGLPTTETLLEKARAHVQAELDYVEEEYVSVTEVNEVLKKLHDTGVAIDCETWDEAKESARVLQ